MSFEDPVIQPLSTFLDTDYGNDGCGSNGIGYRNTCNYGGGYRNTCGNGYGSWNACPRGALVHNN